MYMKNKVGVVGMVILSMLIYTCKEKQYPVKRDAEGRILVNPHPSGEAYSPQESMKHMYLPKGYHLELVASEPMVSQPVTIAWDGDGRMYVAELNTYMKDVDGTGEDRPSCKIVRLEDTNGDGVMDKQTVYADNLVMPRMILPLDNRLLVNETYSNNIYSYEDTNGDGVADVKKLVYKNDSKDDKNLEHQKSGLEWNIDNRIYVTVDPVRYRFTGDELVPDSMRESPGGQWGLTYDDYGRLYFSSAGGETPALNFQQNPYYGPLDVRGQLVGNFIEPWPIIATPDVQGGLMRLRPDSTLNHFTACTGQSVYRGDRLPADMKGDLFICEPVGRIIRRAKVTDDNGKILLTNAYDRQEFLASSDMNFRPVNTFTGPDGCLYIVDMYHGIIQESAWTDKDSYLRPQILRKGLEKNIGRGRIYRVVSDKIKPNKTRPHMLEQSSAGLVQYLSNPNGWWRDNAQKLIVLRGDKSVVPALENLVKNSPMPLARIHALWTLDGLNALDKRILYKALEDNDAQVRKTAIWASEDFMKADNDETITQLYKLETDTSADVRFQLALSLRYNPSPKAKEIISYLVANNPNNEVLVKSQNEYNAVIKAQEMEAEKERMMREADRLLVTNGEVIFKGLCASCHGTDGKGIMSNGNGNLPAPILSGNADVNGNPDKLIAILLHGLTGPVHGKAYADVIMPAQGTNDDTYIASVLSYIRTQLGNKAKTVNANEVNKIRLATAAKTTMWTMGELDSLVKK
jgi:mono/diheme cytochrome c family protein/glucose/arabinose dehydrogenase